MIRPFRAIFLLFFCAAAGDVYGQQFGGNPPSVKLEQVQTPAARVIFPKGLDSAAIRVANIVQQMNGAIQPTIGYKQKQVNIVLQNQTTITNGYVSLAPFRSEFFLTPEQNSFDLGSLYWPDQLAIHEFRHVQQYNNFNVGLSHVLHILFGEGGQALANGMTVPNWFFEGDAVFNETHVSEQGRGRLPYYFNGYRGLWMSNRQYSWQKLRNGSYLDYTPDWYPTGYMLVAYGREKYGDLFWKNVTHDAAAFKGLFYPLQRSIEKRTGLTYEQFRNDAMAHFRQQFAADVSDSAAKDKQVKITRHFDADREYPAFINDSTLVYMKSAYNHLPVFVIKTGEKERSIRVRDVSIDNYFAYRDGKIVYPSYRSDLRWSYRDFSELNILDLKTGKEKHLTNRTKYFAPDFDADAKKIVAVNEAPNGRCEIHILDASTGKIISVVPNNGGFFYTYPKFFGEHKLISAVRNKTGKMSLALIDIKTGKLENLTTWAYQPIGFIHLQGDEVYFTATADKEDRLYKMSIATRRLSELQNFRTAGAVGNYEPAASEHELAWVGFSDVGYQVIRRDKSLLIWRDVDETKIPGSLSNMGITSLKRDSSTDKLAGVMNNDLKVAKYHKSYHLFNFHSLIPSLDDPNYSIALTGENVINTFQSELAFQYNRDEGYKKFGFDAAYGSLFPYILGGVSYTFDRNAFDGTRNVYWNESNAYGGLELPLNFSRGRTTTTLTLASELNYTQANFQQAFTSLYHDYHYSYLFNQVTFVNETQQAKQNIYPRFAQVVNFIYRDGINGLNDSQYLISGDLYLPGILPNHNLVFNFDHQERNSNDLAPFSNDFPFSRGYQAENLRVLNKVGVNYHFPIAYPDAGAFNTAYILRLRGNLFFDYTRGSQLFAHNVDFDASFRSAGAEIYFDTQWFNSLPVTFGVRYSRLLDPDYFGYTGRNRFELIVPVAVF